VEIIGYSDPPEDRLMRSDRCPTARQARRVLAPRLGLATAPAAGRARILDCLNPEAEAGYGLFLDETGACELRVGDGAGRVAHARIEAAPRPRTRHEVSATLTDPATPRASST
jgi:hypothetical protein